MPTTTFLNGRTDYTTLRGGAFVMLSEIGYIVSGSVTSDQGGGGTITWSQGGTAVPCRVDAMGGGEALMGAKISEQTTHVITVPASAVVTPANRFAITNRGTFEITAVPEQTAQFLQTLEAVQI